MNKLISVAFVAASIALASTSAVADSKCKSVDIKVTNQYEDRGTPVKIKVTKVNYRDKEDGKWRDNDLKNTEINAGSMKKIDETLEYVGNEEVPKMQVQFQYKNSDGSWSNKVWSNVTTGLGGSNCIKDKDYNITVTGTTSKK